jgi:ABC-2 type transport system ATP-binding protein
MTSQAHMIDARGLVREYKGGLRAVDAIDLYVDQGEIYGFLGPNGAGKSTTVKMLVTLLPPSGGYAQVGGFDIARQGGEVRRVIGVALQEAALDPLLTAREHLMLQAGLHGFPKSQAKVRADQLLERVGLSGAADRRVSTYSGGMRRRLDLALALVHNPRIVFLDEPTTGLDPQSRSALWEEVRRLAKDEGVTVFLTTQYLEEADSLADRIGIIERGHIVAEGTPDSLKAEIGRPTVEVIPENPSDQARIGQVLAQFGDPGVADPNKPHAIAYQLRGHAGMLPEVVRALDAAQVRLAGLALHAPSLDDVFMAKTGRKLEGAAEGTAEAEAELQAERAPEVQPQPLPPGNFGTRVLQMANLASQGRPAAAATTQLVVREGPQAGESFAVRQATTLGREGDIVVADPEASRRHARIRVVDGSLVVEDLGSLNGTWVDSTRITVPTLLTAGNLVKIGRTVIEVQPSHGPPA